MRIGTAENGVSNPTYISDGPTLNLDQQHKTDGYVNRDSEIAEVIAEEIVSSIDLPDFRI